MNDSIGDSFEAVLLEIRKRLAERLEADLSEVKAESHLMDDLEAESMDVLVLIMDLEEEYDFKIPDEVIPELQTPHKIATYLHTHWKLS